MLKMNDDSESPGTSSVSAETPIEEKYYKCPKCDKTASLLKHHPTKPGRLILECSCNPSGPVMEMDDPNYHEKES